MADTIKILGQAALSSAVLTDVYTVPASKSATISTITVCNRGTLPCTFRISVAIGGASDTNAQYIYYDQAVNAGDTYAITLGITLATTDKLRAYASTNSVSINVFGVEV